MASSKKKYPWLDKYPKTIKWEANIPPVELFSILDTTAAKFPERTCVNFLDTQITYKKIKELSDKFAKGLQEIGISKGDRVGIMMPNCPLYLIAYFAILKVGGVVVNYNPLYTTNELAKQITDSGTEIIITLDLSVTYEKAANLLSISPLERVIVGDFVGYLSGLKKFLFKMFKGGKISPVNFGAVNIDYYEIIDNDGKYSPVKIDPVEDLAVIQYTGGTTGAPKGAMLTHANLYANAVQCGMWFDEMRNGEEKMLGVLPLFHVFAMTVVMNLGVLKACELILYPRLDLKELMKDIPIKRPTLVPGVPTLFAAINNYRDVKNIDLQSIKFCISGGAPLPKEVRKDFESLTGCKLVEGYGLSESSPVVSCNPLFGKSRDGSIGLPFPDTVIEIRSPEGRKKLMPSGKIGEICITGPQVMKGYFNKPNDTKETIISGRLHTGDLGYMDKDGYIFVVDRLKEMIITSGFNVYPREVEEEIHAHPFVEEVAVIGEKDDMKGQVVKAFIKLKKDKKLERSELQEFLYSRLAKYKIPSIIEYREELPKTLIGKVSKKDLD